MIKLPSNSCMYGDRGWDEFDEEKIFCLKDGEWCPYLQDGIDQEMCDKFVRIE